MFTHSATQFEVSYPFEELKHIQTPRESSRLRQILLVYSVGCVQFCSLEMMMLNFLLLKV